MSNVPKKEFKIATFYNSFVNADFIMFNHVRQDLVIMP